MTELLRHLEANYDTVIFEVPPVPPVADGLLIGSFVEGVIAVARVGETTRDRLRRSKDAVLKVNTNLLGVVPNQVIQREDSAHAYRTRSEGADSLKPYTTLARLPEVDAQGHDLGAQTAGDGDRRPIDSTP